MPCADIFLDFEPRAHIIQIQIADRFHGLDGAIRPPIRAGRPNSGMRLGRVTDIETMESERGRKMTGSDILKEVLRTAIQREADSTALYTHIAQNVKNPEARAKFERLAEMEQGHRDIVDGAYTRYIGPVDFEPKPMDLPDFSSEEMMRANARSALEMAIRREKEAQEFYRKLAEQLGESEGSELCNKMEQEEQSHQKILEDELRVLSNQFYWYPMLGPSWKDRENI